MSEQDVKYTQLESMVQTHHTKIHGFEKTFGQTPDPATLRHMEHVIKELPPTDDIKDVVKVHTERSAMFKRITWGLFATVAGTLALTTMSLIWQGIALAINGGNK